MGFNEGDGRVGVGELLWGVIWVGGEVLLY